MYIQGDLTTPPDKSSLSRQATPIFWGFLCEEDNTVPREGLALLVDLLDSTSKPIKHISDRVAQVRNYILLSLNDAMSHEVPVSGPVKLDATNEGGFRRGTWGVHIA